MKRTHFLLMLTLVTTALVPHGESRAAAADFTMFLPYVAKNSSLGSLPGTGGSGIQVQNLDPTQDAQIVGAFSSQAGGASVTISRPNVAAGTAANFYLQPKFSQTVLMRPSSPPIAPSRPSSRHGLVFGR